MNSEFGNYELRDAGYEYCGVKLGGYCRVISTSEFALIVGFAKEEDDIEDDKDFIILRVEDGKYSEDTIREHSSCATDVLVGHEDDLFNYYSLSNLIFMTENESNQPQESPNYPSDKLTQQNIDYAKKYYEHYIDMLRDNHLNSTNDDTGWITDSVICRIMNLLGLTGNDKMFEDEFFNIIGSGIQYKNDFEIVVMSIKSTIEKYNKGEF